VKQESSVWPGHLLYVLVLVLYAFVMPSSIWDPNSKDYLFLIGYIAAWRYSWWFINVTRYLIYTKIVFPKWRKQSEELGEYLLPSEVYLLVTSFRIGTDTTRRVYDSVIVEAINYSTKYNRPVTILASIVEKCDENIIRTLMSKYDIPNNIKFVFIRIKGTGKRDALAFGFRAIANQNPAPDAICAVIDGDSLLEKDLIERCACLFKLHPKMGALTTDEICLVEGNKFFKEWYSLRFAQRNIYMSSVSLSKKVLTLTGRMSMFRADIVTNPEFIERVELDWLDHWRLGRFKFLTGDDKSSWYHILKMGYEMLYVPDVKVLTIETPPDPSFYKSSVVLMRRWFGNMLRTNGRALKIGIKTVGFFPWISILDQRMSMWTALTGLTVTALAIFSHSVVVIVYYVYWMLITRYILVLSFLVSRPRVSALWPFFLYYNQIVGSFVKIYVFFRLDKQKWTRQNTVLTSTKSGLKQRMTELSSFYMHFFAFCLFITVLGNFSRMIKVPSFEFWINIIS
jgi:mannuronan synthase